MSGAGGSSVRVRTERKSKQAPVRSGIVGRTYLERGEAVVVLVQWRTGCSGYPAGPRNVLIERPDGTRVVRPFRGLRLPKKTLDNPTT